MGNSSIDLAGRECMYVEHTPYHSKRTNRVPEYAPIRPRKRFRKERRRGGQRTYRASRSFGTNSCDSTEAPTVLWITYCRDLGRGSSLWRCGYRLVWWRPCTIMLLHEHLEGFAFDFEILHNRFVTVDEALFFEVEGSAENRA